jgi:hypothetical protein
MPVFAEKKRRRFRPLPAVEKSAAKMSPTSGQIAFFVGGIFQPGCLVVAHGARRLRWGGRPLPGRTLKAAVAGSIFRSAL